MRRGISWVGGFVNTTLQKLAENAAVNTGIRPWNGRGVSSWIQGIGIHSGVNSRVRFLSAPNEPIRIRTQKTEIMLVAESVIDTTLATKLGYRGARVSTVEHLLAALYVLGHWRGFVIEVDGPEIPILDGSGLGWALALAELTPEPTPNPFNPYDTAVEIRGGYVGLESFKDGEPMQISVSVGFAHPAIGEQSWTGKQADWLNLLDARTFGFEREIERLWASGRGLGAREDNAVVYNETGPSVPTRGADEVVRHKALDLLGDLYLVGRPLQAHVVSERASHEAHVAFALELRSQS
jgi:UDP-3-O-[3-hydroxymyristoyl] N-acetylglucosamine deacetylase